MSVLPYFEDIKELNEFLLPFPNSDDIFVENQPWLKDHFLPLISIDLGMLKDKWRGQVVHMLNPLEPYDGYIGEHTTEYHNKYTSANWLAFKLTDDNHYEFLGDERYFVRSSKNDFLHLFDEETYGKEFYDGFQDYIEESIAYYKFRQANFKETGKLMNVYNSEDDKYATWQNWLDGMGGELSERSSHWFSSLELPAAFFGQWQDDGLSIHYNDNPFYHIADVPAYHYGCQGADKIILMYEPISRIVLFTYDWI